MGGFLMLSNSVWDSTLMLLPHDAIVAFWWSLAHARPSKDHEGMGEVTVPPPVIAMRINVTLERFWDIVAIHTAPDKWSRSTEYEGRRWLVEQEPFTILIPNFGKYRNMDYTGAERQARFRARHKSSEAASGNAGVTLRNAGVTEDNAGVTPDNANVTYEHEHEHEKEQEKKEGVTSPRQRDSSGPKPEEVVALYNSMLGDVLPQVMKITEQRRRHIRARSKDLCPTLDRWKELFEAVRSSPFLLGENPRRWQCNFDWLLSEGAAAKVLEGVYGSRRKNGLRRCMECGKPVDDKRPLALCQECEARLWEEAGEGPPGKSEGKGEADA